MHHIAPMKLWHQGPRPSEPLITPKKKLGNADAKSAFQEVPIQFRDGAIEMLSVVTPTGQAANATLAANL